MNTILLISLLFLTIIEVVHLICNLVILHLNNKIKAQREMVAKTVLDHMPENCSCEVITITLPMSSRKNWKISLPLKKAIEDGWEVDLIDV